MPIFNTNHKVKFSSALELLKKGYVATRLGWNGNRGFFFDEIKMYIYLVDSSLVPINDLRGNAKKFVPDSKHRISKDVVHISSHIDMVNAKGGITVGWNPSQEDMMATDWIIGKVEGE